MLGTKATDCGCRCRYVEGKKALGAPMFQIRQGNKKQFPAEGRSESCGKNLDRIGSWKPREKESQEEGRDRVKHTPQRDQTAELSIAFGHWRAGGNS